MCCGEVTDRSLFLFFYVAQLREQWPFWHYTVHDVGTEFSIGRQQKFVQRPFKQYIIIV